MKLEIKQKNKKYFIILVTIVTLAVVVSAVTPLIIEKLIIKSVSSINKNIHIGKISVKIIPLSIKIRNVSLKEGISIEKIDIIPLLSIKSLVKKKILIKGIYIDNVKLQPSLKNGKIVFTGLDQSPKSNKKTSKSKDWSIKITDFKLSNTTMAIKKHSPMILTNMNLRDTEITLESIHLNIMANLKLLNGTANIGGTLTVQKTSKKINIKILLNGIDLSKLLSLTDKIYTIKGTVDGKLGITMRDIAPHFSFTGQIKDFFSNGTDVNKNTLSAKIIKIKNLLFKTDKNKKALLSNSIIINNFHLKNIPERKDVALSIKDMNLNQLDLTSEEKKLTGDLDSAEFTNFTVNNTTENKNHFFTKNIMLKKLFINNQNKDYFGCFDFIKMSNPIFGLSFADSNPEKIRSKFTTLKIHDGHIEYTNKNENVFLLSKGMINDHGKFNIEFLTQSNKKNMSFTLNKIDLIPFSTLFENLLGYQVKSGQTSLNYMANIKNRKKTGKIKLALHQLNIDSPKKSDRKISKKTVIPLDMIVAGIKDNRGEIKANFDIKGNDNETNIDFFPKLSMGLGDYIVEKIVNFFALKLAENFAPMLTNAIPFSPFTAFKIAKGGFEFVTKPRFRDIEFKACSTESNQLAGTELLKLSKFLKDNSNFNFHFCPLPTINEMAAPDSDPLSKDEALELAYKRMETIKSLLKENPNMIFCRPVVTDKFQKSGIIEITL